MSQRARCSSHPSKFFSISPTHCYEETDPPAPSCFSDFLPNQLPPNSGWNRREPPFPPTAQRFTSSTPQPWAAAKTPCVRNHAVLEQGSVPLPGHLEGRRWSQLPSWLLGQQCCPFREGIGLSGGEQWSPESRCAQHSRWLLGIRLHCSFGIPANTNAASGPCGSGRHRTHFILSKALSLHHVHFRAQ